MSRITAIVLSATLALSTLAACEDNSPEAVAARQWKQDLEPLLSENSLLAEQVLESAALIYNGQGEPLVVRTRWSDNVVPVAQHLQHQAELVTPPPMYAEKHQQLVQTWTDRNAAYSDILVALETGDKELWTKARKQSDEAKLREEKWFQATNDELEKYKVSLDQFP